MDRKATKENEAVWVGPVKRVIGAISVIQYALHFSVKKFINIGEESKD